jgi:type II secretory pathway pseudopilin PulG
MNTTPQRSSFTLLEILLVVAAVGLLAAIVFVAINPNEQLAKVRDTERQSEVDTLHDAIRQYNIDNSEWPDEIASMSANSAKEICAEGVSDETCINLTDDLTPEYIAEVPSGPNTEGTKSGYVVSKQNTRVRVAARNVEERSNGIAAGYSSNRLLDAHPFATLAYSIRLLRAGHVTETIQSSNTTAGSYLVRIRQDNANNDTADVLPDENGELSMDSTVQNTSNSADGQTLQTWVGGSNAYVTAWYDQSGNQDNGLSSVDAEQPQIISAGNFITKSTIPQLQFDGDDYLALEKFYESANICSMTVSARVSMPDTGGGTNFSFDRSEYFRFAEGGHAPEGKLGFGTGGNDGTGDLAGNTDIDDNTRQHVAAVFEESANPDKNVYVDGQSDGSAEQHNGCLGKNTRYGSIGVGSEMRNFDGSKGGGYQYNGTIEQVVFYEDQALSDREITDLYERYE